MNPLMTGPEEIALHVTARLPEKTGPRAAMVAALAGLRNLESSMEAQTDGGPLATLAQEAAGDPDVHLAALERAIADAGVQLTRVSNLGGAQGCSRPGQIALLDSLTPADTMSVLVHEFTHLCSAVGYVRWGPGEVAPWRARIPKPSGHCGTRPDRSLPLPKCCSRSAVAVSHAPLQFQQEAWRGLVRGTNHTMAC